MEKQFKLPYDRVLTYDEQEALIKFVNDNENKLFRLLNEYGQPSCMHCKPDQIGYIIEVVEP